MNRVAAAMQRKAYISDDPSWFADQLEAANQTLEDAVTVADMPGGLSDNYGAIAKATADIRRNVSRAIHRHVGPVRRLPGGKRAAASHTLRQVKRILMQQAFNLVQRPGDLKESVDVYLGGRGRDWSIEVVNDTGKRMVEKVIPGLGGYKAGYGGWVLSQGYQTSGDWNDPSSRHHYAAGSFNNTTEARRGDLIQSFNVTNPPDPGRVSYLGRVTKVEVDVGDGVPYVHYTVLARLRGGVAVKHSGPTAMRAPQNGVPTSMGKTTDGIHVIK